ncbi:MAG: hypothetical protein AUJ12_02895 [Alphaproteobacteria bacterium CG1_02_46_17]|nr:MAG: hypothetical protein AUJ12_02895 [Alphaproteobacteria bacterium CG1_02_46_17]
MNAISKEDLIPFNLVARMGYPVAVDHAYAKASHPENVFGQIYHPDANLWGHIDMVALTVLAAQKLHKEYEWTLVIKDCLRPVEAQQKIMETDIVRANPHWLVEPKFLSSPGQGGHPRGMAIDIAAQDKFGQTVDFGTAFDSFSGDAHPEKNPAHRNYPYSSEQVKENRARLDNAMLEAAQKMGRNLLLLSTEWWDFRFPSDEIGHLSPIEDGHLEDWQKIMTAPAKIPQQQERRMASMLTNLLQKFDYS